MICVIHTITQRAFSTASMWVWSCAISFITISIVNSITLKFSWKLQFWQACAICITTDLIVGIVISLVFRSQLFKRIVTRYLAVTPVDETISNVVDWENGSNAVIYLKNEPSLFLGHIRTVGDGDGDGWICISAPIKYDKDGNELYSHEDENDTYLTIPLSEIRYIKIVN